MKKILLIALSILAFTNIYAQNAAQKIYDTEKAFEKSVAENGLNQAFINFSTKDGICLFPSYPVNCIEFFKTQPPSTAALAWNPTFIDVSSNGVLAYSIGNSVYKPNGATDANASYVEYATVWQRQPDGNYKAVLDLGVPILKPDTETKYVLAEPSSEMNEKRNSAADTSTSFFEMAGKQGLTQAGKMYYADDVRVLREGAMPIVGKKAALKEFKNQYAKFFSTKRSVFVGAADLAYISNTYYKWNAGARDPETGTFLHVWKFRDGKWQIVLDVLMPGLLEKKS